MNVFEPPSKTAASGQHLSGGADDGPENAVRRRGDGAAGARAASRVAAPPAIGSFRRLPPLNALRTFEAAARHLSFTKAAGELHVTPAAVGQQVRLLEDFVGVPLFHRTSRTLALTDAGAACLPEIREAFERLAAAVARINSADQAGPLNISVAPSLAAKWLLPRLERFEAAHPEIDVRVEAAMQVVDLHRSNVDLAIRYGPGRYPGLVVERLMGEAVVPVCSPVLLQGEHPLRTPDDIRFHTLLHDDSPDDDQTCPNWAMWLRAAGVEGVDASRGPRFNQSSLVLEAAVLGRGVALAKARIAAADLAAGRVVKPFEITQPVEFSYYMVCIEAKARMRKIEVFREWLRAEAAQG
ncbi:MAG: transcriptional regulator GcvA [Rhodospirillaceae bacterium]|nr:transcriptional regulator GcvA [Rhodospirillaceae bacterium]